MSKIEDKVAANQVKTAPVKKEPRATCTICGQDPCLQHIGLRPHIYAATGAQPTPSKLKRGETING